MPRFVKGRSIDCMGVTKAGKLIEPPQSEASQKCRSSTRHLRFADNVCVNSNPGPISQFFQPDGPFSRKSSVLCLRQVPNQRWRIARPYYVSTRDHNWVVELTDERTSNCPRVALPAQIGIHVGERCPGLNVCEQAPNTLAGELCSDGIGEGSGHGPSVCIAKALCHDETRMKVANYTH